MQLNGKFVVRQVGTDIIAVPIGETALRFNGMILLNEVSKIIWECLERGTTPEDILKAVTDKFEVSEETAKSDISEFLQNLRKIEMLTE